MGGQPMQQQQFGQNVLLNNMAMGVQQRMVSQQEQYQFYDPSTVQPQDKRQWIYRIYHP